MRRVLLRQCGCRDRCEPDRLAYECAPGLFEDQSEFSKTQPETARGIWNEKAKPPKFSCLSQPLGRKTRILLAKSARHLRSSRVEELCGGVAQQDLFRCQMQVHGRNRANFRFAVSIRKVQDAARHDVALDLRGAAIDGRAPDLKERR
jgi:hypothetical protein